MVREEEGKDKIAYIYNFTVSSIKDQLIIKIIKQIIVIPDKVYFVLISNAHLLSYTLSFGCGSLFKIIECLTSMFIRILNKTFKHTNNKTNLFIHGDPQYLRNFEFALTV